MRDDSILADPRVLRVVNTLSQFRLGYSGSAKFLRDIADWYEPPGMRACETCGEPFPRRSGKRHCGTACRQAAYRRRKRNEP